MKKFKKTKEPKMEIVSVSPHPPKMPRKNTVSIEKVKGGHIIEHHDQNYKTTKHIATSGKHAKRLANKYLGFRSETSF